MNPKVDLELVHGAAGLIQKHFFFEELKSLLPQNEAEALEQLKKQLSERIAHMIDHDFELLMHILYRIDLKEEKVNECLFAGNGEPSDLLAEMVIERQIQKAETRRRYRQ